MNTIKTVESVNSSGALSIPKAAEDKKTDFNNYLKEALVKSTTCSRRRIKPFNSWSGKVKVTCRRP